MATRKEVVVSLKREHGCIARLISIHNDGGKLTPTPRPPTLKAMEVELTPDLQAKLTRMSEQQGRNCAALITEAVERLVTYDAWFTSEVEKGLAAADCGELWTISLYGR